MSPKPSARCLRCGAPIQFQPGAGSRLCPFCDTINLVREQKVAAPRKELETDEVFFLLQRGKPEEALAQAERLISTLRAAPRLGLYRAQALLSLGRISEAVYALIDLTGEEAPRPLRADIYALLAEALWSTGRKKEAAEAADKSLNLLAGHPAATLVKVNLLMEEDRTEAALALIEKSIRDLDKPWKVSFPPPAWKFFLIMARLQLRTGRVTQAIETLENFLSRLLSAPLTALAEAFRRLGWAYLHQEPTGTHGMELVRLSLLLEGVGAVAEQVLASVLEKIGGDLKEHLQQLQERRARNLNEVCDKLRQVGSWAAGEPKPNSLLQALGNEADARVDLLEQTARQLGLVDFDRGTLYPLQTVEDYYRWVEAGRGRIFLQRFRRERLEKERLAKLRQLHLQQGEPIPDKDRSPHGARRFWVRMLRWSAVVVLSVVVLAALVLVIIGDRWLNVFSGRLLAIDCKTAGSECWLLVDMGEEGRLRYRHRRENPSAIGRWLGSWLDQGLRQDGMLYYSLDLPWGRLSAERYRSCLGKTVAKNRFHFDLECQP